MERREDGHLGEGAKPEAGRVPALSLFPQGVLSLRATVLKGNTG